jgi:hypothetical protein
LVAMMMLTCCSRTVPALATLSTVHVHAIHPVFVVPAKVCRLNRSAARLGVSSLHRNKKSRMTLNLIKMARLNQMRHMKILPVKRGRMPHARSV